MHDPSELVDVSVIICVLNGEHVIAQQLSALRDQEFDGSWELVVVDNGSTDATVAVVERAAADFGVPVRVVDASQRRGICSARNAGATAARGRVLAFCDCDDRVAPGWVAAAFRACSEADVVGGATRRLTDPFEPDAPYLNPTGVVTSAMGAAVHGCNFAVERSAFFAFGGFDEALPPYGMDDTEFSFRVSRAGGSVVGSPDMVVYFRETTDLRALLRKLYLSGKAEYAVWQRFPDEYRDRLGLYPCLRELSLFVPQMVTLTVRGPKPQPKAMARELTNRMARVVACVEATRSGRRVQPALLAPSDDPLGVIAAR